MFTWIVRGIVTLSLTIGFYWIVYVPHISPKYVPNLVEIRNNNESGFSVDRESDLTFSSRNYFVFVNPSTNAIVEGKRVNQNAECPKICYIQTETVKPGETWLLSKDSLTSVTVESDKAVTFKVFPSDLNYFGGLVGVALFGLLVYVFTLLIPPLSLNFRIAKRT